MENLLMLKVLQVVGTGMTGLHRLSITRSDDKEEEEWEVWGWLLHDLAWIKLGMMQPLLYIVAAHTLGAFVLLLKTRDVNCRLLLIMLGFVLFIGSLRFGLIGVEEYLFIVCGTSMVFVLLPLVQELRQAKRLAYGTGSRWAWQLVSYASLLAVGFKDSDCPIQVWITLATGGFVAIVPLMLHSIIRPKWVLVGGKLKEKSSFNFTMP